MKEYDQFKKLNSPDEIFNFDEFKNKELKLQQVKQEVEAQKSMIKKIGFSQFENIMSAINLMKNEKDA